MIDFTSIKSKTFIQKERESGKIKLKSFQKPHPKCEGITKYTLFSYK